MERDVTPLPEPTANDPALASRRDVLVGLGVLPFALAGGLAAAAPAGADAALDVEILQTASSLERLATDTYTALLAAGAPSAPVLASVTPPVAHDTLVTALTTTMKQHGDHLRLFQNQTTTLGGTAQDQPNPRFQPVWAQQLAGVDDLKKLLDFVAAVEKVLTDTYLRDLTQLQDRRSKELLAGVLGVEAQFLGTFRILGSLVGSPELIAVPLPESAVAKLPAAVCTQAFPDPLHQVSGPEGIADPASGAVR